MRRRQFFRVAQALCAPMALRPARFGSLREPAVTRASVGAESDPEGRRSPWQPDGWAWRGRLGLLLPHSDTEPDSEFAALAPDGVSTHAMRVRYSGGAQSADPVTRARSFVEPPGMDEAAELLAQIGPNAIALCYTSASYLHGPDGDRALKARLETRTRGVPVALTCSSAVAALRAFGAKRVALVHPPWFSEEIDRRGAEYFQHQGFEVAYHARALLRTDRGNIHAGALYEWVRANVPREAEAIFMGGNGMRTIGAIQALEESLGKPVLTSNQVAFWGALRMANIPARVSGYGRLFEKQLL
ncbi:MAG TPA: maleate cis-trans isomerase [Candidatus Dormibacteraeota bacterium]|nr:maleate cis-trans isomerase [Candidatus Dormibacteraeota bacterium]